MHDIRDQLEILMEKLTVMRNVGLSVEIKNAYQARLEDHLKNRNTVNSAITIILQNMDMMENATAGVVASTADLLDGAALLAKVRAREELESQCCIGLQELNQLRHTLDELSLEKEHALNEIQSLKDNNEYLKCSKIEEMDNAITRVTLTLSDLVNMIERELQQHLQSEQDIQRSIAAKRTECHEVNAKLVVSEAELENLRLQLCDMKSKVAEMQQAIHNETNKLESLQEDASNAESHVQSLKREEVQYYFLDLVYEI